MESIEDPFDQDDWTAYSDMQSRVGVPVDVHRMLHLVTVPLWVTAGRQDPDCW